MVENIGENFMSDVTRPGRELHARFKTLGDMTGKNVAVFLRTVGPPTSRSMVGNDLLLQWQATGYHIAVLFDASERFLRITHELGNYEPEPNYTVAIVFIVVVLAALFAFLIVSELHK